MWQIDRPVVAHLQQSRGCRYFPSGGVADMCAGAGACGSRYVPSGWQPAAACAATGWVQRTPAGARV